MPRRPLPSAAVKPLLAAAALAVPLAFAPAASAQATWADGDGNWSVPANWSPADVPNTAAEDAVINNGSAVTLDGSFSIGSFTLGAADSLTVPNGQTLTLDGDFSNAGTLTLNASSSFTSLSFTDGAHQVTGTGEIVLSAAAGFGSNARITGAGTPVVTFGAGQTVRGTGNVGSGVLVLTNNGTFAADALNRTLILDPDNAAGVTFTNNGTLRAANGGTLLLTGSGTGAFGNSGGAIQAQTGSTVRLEAGADVTGGTLSTAGTGQFSVGAATLRTLTTNGAINVENGGALSLDGAITNNGTIALNASSSFTDLSLGSVTLNGSGSLVLAAADGFASNARVTGPGTPTLTNAATHTIAGTGNLGSGVVVVTNAGLVTANVNGRTLRVDPDNAAAVTFTNTGTLRAENGGILSLSGSGTGSFDNAGGTIESITGGTVVLTEGADVTGGQLAGTVSVNSSAALRNLTNTGAVTVVNGGALTPGGTLVNNGTVTLAASSAFTDLALPADATVNLNGTGAVVLSAAAGFNSNARITGFGTPTLNVGAQQTVRGEGNLGAGVVVVNNAGLISADQSGRTLTLDPDNVAAVSFTNTGTLRATGGGLLALSGSGGGTFDNTGGTIEAVSGGTVQLVSSVDVTGGTVGGTVQITNTAALRDLTLRADAAATVLNGGALTPGGTLVNNGTVTLNASSAFTDLALPTNATVNLNGTGAVVLSAAAGFNSNARITGFGTPTLNVGAQQTVRGEGNLGAGVVVVNNAGTVAATVNGRTLTVDPDNVVGTSFNNAGTLRAANGGTLALSGSGGGSFSNAGTIEALAGSTVNLVSGGTVVQVDPQTAASFDDRITGGTFRAVNGTLNVSPAGFIVQENLGTIELSGTQAMTDLFDEAASTPGNLTNSGRGFTNSSGARLRLDDGVHLTVFNVDNDPGATLEVVGGATLTVTTGALSNRGTLFADGTIDGGGFINNNGTVEFGDGPDAIGTLTASELANQVFSNTNLDIASLTSFDTFDVAGDLFIEDNAGIEALLNVDLLGGFTPAPGDEFAIATFGTITGNFQVINDNSPFVDFVSIVDEGAGTVTLRAVAVPEPSSLALLLAAPAALLRRRRR